MLIDKRFSPKDFIGYVVSQCIGAIAGIALLALIINSADLGGFAVTGLGQNGFDDVSAVGLSMIGAVLVEIILTFVFVFTILGVTDDEKTSAIAGIVIGLTLVFVHIMGIPLTGTSVNPARSLAPALLIGGVALQQVWVFIIAPLIGGSLAALVYRFFKSDKSEAKA